MKRIWTIASTAFLLSIFALILAFMLRSFLYPAPSIKVGQPPQLYQEVTIPWGKGDSMIGWYHPGTPGIRRPTLLYFHGNGENLQTMQMSGLLEMLIRLEVAVLAVDYPGYGRSSGKTTEAAIYSAGDAAVGWIRARKDTEGEWVAAGWSLGAAVATHCASRNPEGLNGLIALSPWSSLQEVARLHLPGWLVGYVLEEKYDSLAIAGTVRCPALVIHGERDTLIPVALGEKLSKAFPDSKWISLAQTGHNDLLSHPRVPQEMHSFLNQLSSR